MTNEDWAQAAAEELASHFSFGSGPDCYVTDEQRANVARNYRDIILKHYRAEPRVKDHAK